MSGLARLLHERGTTCTGSDDTPSDLTESLRSDGTPISYDQSAAQLPGASEAQCMVRSRAEGIRFGEPEQNAVRAMHEHFGVSLPWG